MAKSSYLAKSAQFTEEAFKNAVGFFTSMFYSKKSKVSPNAFLLGPFAPVKEETVAYNLELVGQIPKQFAGMYIRNGANPHYTPEGEYHWFEGDGMLHGVLLKDGKASYVNRFVRTSDILKEELAGRPLWRSAIGGGWQLLYNILLNVLNTGKPFKSTGNTSLLLHHQKLLALMEGALPTEIKQEFLLPTLEEYDFNGQWKTKRFTAHPKVDPVTGELIAFGYDLGKQPYLDYGVFTPDGKLSHYTVVDMKEGTMMHDFAITEHYSLFLDLNIAVRARELLNNKSPIVFDPLKQARIGFLPRFGDGTKDIMWINVKACHVFHTVNAFEEGEDVIVLQASRYAYFDLTGMSTQNNPPKAYEWRLDIKSRTVISEGTIDDAHGMEFPHVSSFVTGRKHRYFYGVHVPTKSSVSKIEPNPDSGYLKYDLSAPEMPPLIHRLKPEELAQEAFFVKREGGTEEDDGYLLSYTYNSISNTSEMIIFDAKEFEAPPICRIRLPNRVPLGFHGLYVPGIVK